MSVFSITPSKNNGANVPKAGRCHWNLDMFLVSKRSVSTRTRNLPGRGWKLMAGARVSGDSIRWSCFGIHRKSSTSRCTDPGFWGGGGPLNERKKRRKNKSSMEKMVCSKVLLGWVNRISLQGRWKKNRYLLGSLVSHERKTSSVAIQKLPFQFSEWFKTWPVFLPATKNFP